MTRNAVSARGMAIKTGSSHSEINRTDVYRSYALAYAAYVVTTAALAHRKKLGI